MNIFTQFFKSGTNEGRKQAIIKDLIRRESELTRDIFGPVPRGTRREFFCLDKNTWVWFEEWTNENGQRQQLTTRYIVRPNEILKSQNGGAYHRLSIDEAQNFHKAAKSYQSKVKTHLYTENKPASA